MSEHAPKSAESHKKSPENHETIHQVPEKLHKSHETTHEVSAEQTNETLKAIRHEVAYKAKSSKEYTIDKSENETKKVSQPLINKELKEVMLKRTLSRVQKKLPPSQRALSKVVHNNSVEAVSAIGEKTIARPIGIFGGGLFALLGSLFSTYLSKTFGMKYNLLVFAILFVFGYMVASLLEVLFAIAKKSKRVKH
jgi:flagellar biosynthesis GTPase FlhF